MSTLETAAVPGSVRAWLKGHDEARPKAADPVVTWLPGQGKYRLEVRVEPDTSEGGYSTYVPQLPGAPQRDL